MVRERSPAQFKPTSSDAGWLEPRTLSCPGLLRPQDGRVEKNKGIVTMISHTPPTFPLPHPEIRTRRRFHRMAFLVNSSPVFVLAECGCAGNDMNIFFTVILMFSRNSNMRGRISSITITKSRALTSRICSSCCSLSSFLDVVVIRPEGKSHNMNN